MKTKSGIEYFKVYFDKILDKEYEEMLEIVMEGFKKDLTNKE